jgi:TRAP-type C4-dicarboxylate transport system substrate-binding protein
MKKSSVSKLTFSLAMFLLLVIFIIPAACTATTPPPAPASSAAASAAAAPAKEAEFVIHNASGQPPTGTQSEAAILWGNLMEQRSNGRIKMEHHWSQVLGPTKTILDMIQANSMKGVTHGPPGVYFSFLVPWIDITGLPSIFTSYQDAWAVYDGWLTQALGQDLEKKGMKLVGMREGGIRQFMSTKGPINSPADIKGLKYRVAAGEIETRVAQAWGVVPTTMDFGEVYSALEAGVVDAVDFPIFSSVPLKYNEVAKYTSVSNIKHAPMFQVLSKAYFDSLPPDIQKIILDAGRDAFNDERNKILEAEKTSVDKLIKAGQKFSYMTPENMAKFKELVQPVYSWAAGKYGKDVVGRLTGQKFQ